MILTNFAVSIAFTLAPVVLAHALRARQIACSAKCAGATAGAYRICRRTFRARKPIALAASRVRRICAAMHPLVTPALR